MRLRAMRQGYRLQGPSSGFNQYGGYSTPVEAVFGCGYAAAADAAPTATTACNKSRRWEMTQARQENHTRGIEEESSEKS
jgi:hypothetical protein